MTLEERAVGHLHGLAVPVSLFTPQPVTTTRKDDMGTEQTKDDNYQDQYWRTSKCYLRERIKCALENSFHLALEVL